MQVTILGSSGAMPRHGRFPSSQYVQLNNTAFLIDCGEGAQFQLHTHQLSIMRLQAIFISHLHGDHYLGLMGLLFTMHLQKREKPLQLYAAKELKDIISLQLKAAQSALSYPITFHVLQHHQQEIIFENTDVVVRSFPLVHKIPTCGFSFQTQPTINLDKEKITGLSRTNVLRIRDKQDVATEQGTTIPYQHYLMPQKPTKLYAYCSDTMYNPALKAYVEHADVLYHEATFLEQAKDKALETKHSTAADAARIAQACEVKKLLIGHFSARYEDASPLLAEAQTIFPNTELAEEGKTITL